MNRNKITSIVLATTILLETVPVVNAYDNVTLNDNIISIGNTENEEENDLDKDSTNPIDTTDAPQNNDINNSSNTNSDNLEESDFDINDFIDNSNINNNELGDTIDSDYIQEEVEDGIIQDEVYDDMFIDKEEVDISITNDNNNTIENSGQVKSNVLEISLADGEYVPDLTGNPDGYDTIKVTTIGNKKLVSTDYNRLRESLIPNIDLSNANSDSIPTGAFANATHLTSFQFPQGIKSIDNASSFSNGAFYNCTGLTGELIIPDSVTSIGDYAFYKCSGFTGNLIIPDSVTYIGREAFRRCSGFTGNLVIPDSVTSISAYAFNGCSGLTGNLVIPDSVTYIGDYAFYGCSGFNGNLIISDSVTSIGQYAFYNCSGFTGNLIIPDSVESIGDYAFNNCTGFNGELILGDSLVTIGSRAFYGCSSLSGELSIPNSVTSINSGAFMGCKGFNGDLIIPNSITTIQDTVFSGCSGFDGVLIIPDGVTSIGTEAFDKCSGLTGDLIIPDSVVSIGQSAFRECSGFKGNLILGDSLETIALAAFTDCTGFTGDLIIPDSVTSIGNRSFNNCTGFNGILKISNSITSIGEYVFNNCKNLKGDIVIPNTVLSIGKYAFYNCYSFNGDLLIGDSVESIGDYAFAKCSGFRGELKLNNMLRSIGRYAFDDCWRLTGNIIVPDSLQTLGNFAALNCSNVNKIIMKADESFIDLNYRKEIYDLLNTNKRVVEMSYNFDTTGTWLETIDDSSNGKPKIISSDFENKGREIKLYIPTPYSEDDIIIRKNGEEYILPTKNDNNEYIFIEKGLYDVTVTTTLGTVSNMTFEVIPSVNKPTINYENGLFTIIDNGNILGNPTDCIEYRINGGEWQEYNNSFRVDKQLIIDNKVTIEARVKVSNDISEIEETTVDIYFAEIIAEDKIIELGSSFNDKDGVIATDIDGSDISHSVNISYINVDIDNVGEYKIIYNVTGSNGYEVEKEIKVTVIKTNTPPTIIAEDTTVFKGDEFNPLDYITATDLEDGDIDKSNIEIIQNTVNMNKVGTYYITYKVTDNDGESTIKTINVKVAREAVIIVSDMNISIGDSFDAKSYVMAINSDDIDVSKDVIVKFNNVDTSKEGTYTVIYEFTDVNGEIITKEVSVVVSNENNNNNNNNKDEQNNESIPNAGGFSSLYNTIAIINVIFGLTLLKKKNKY